VRFQSLMQELGTPAPRFAVADPAGRIYRLADFDTSPALLVAFICNHCPFVLHILDAFTKMAAEYQPKGLATVAISSNDIVAHPEDAPAKMAELARERGFTFPYLYDENQEAARQFGAVCTPDFFLYHRQRKLYYRGQFDATRPQTPHTAGRPGAGAAPTGSDMRAAIDALLARKPASANQKPSVGCSMKWKPGNEPEWG
jgi:peroxiredoxin